MMSNGEVELEPFLKQTEGYEEHRLKVMQWRRRCFPRRKPRKRAFFICTLSLFPFIFLLIILFCSSWSYFHCAPCKVQYVEDFRKSCKGNISVSNEIYKATETVRIATFNVWNMGRYVENGVQKVAEHILSMNVDIVALQEVPAVSQLGHLLCLLGTEWSVVYPHADRPDVAILARYMSVWKLGEGAIENGFVGARIFKKYHPKIVEFDFWSVHLPPWPFGPDEVCYLFWRNETVPQLMSDAWLKEMESRRLVATEALLSQIEVHERNINTTVIVAGDFNSPSHTDYRENVILSDYCNGKFTGTPLQWPVTKILENNGFADSYRTVRTNIAVFPGATWSPVHKSNVTTKKPAPQDRIDMILLRDGQRNVRILKSEVYHGGHAIETEPNQQHNHWPSDHAAVFTDYQF